MNTVLILVFPLFFNNNLQYCFTIIQFSCKLMILSNYLAIHLDKYKSLRKSSQILTDLWKTLLLKLIQRFINSIKKIELFYFIIMNLNLILYCAYICSNKKQNIYNIELNALLEIL